MLFHVMYLMLKDVLCAEGEVSFKMVLYREVILELRSLMAVCAMEGNEEVDSVKRERSLNQKVNLSMLGVAS